MKAHKKKKECHVVITQQLFASLNPARQGIHSQNDDISLTGPPGHVKVESRQAELIKLFENWTSGLSSDPAC